MQSEIIVSFAINIYEGGDILFARGGAAHLVDGSLI